MVRISRLVLTTVLAVVAGAAPFASGSASAATGFDLYALRSPGLHINTGSCRSVAVTAKTTAGPDVTDVSANVDLWLGNKQVDSAMLTPVNGDPRTLAGDFYFCPNLDAPGRYRLGSSEVDWTDQNYNDSTFIDDSRGTMVIKQATRARVTGSRTGATRTFHAHCVYFGAGYSNSWVPYPKGTKVSLQRRSAAGTGSWRNIATHRVARHGNVSFSLRAGKPFQYRVSSAGTARSWPMVSAPLIK